MTTVLFSQQRKASPAQWADSNPIVPDGEIYVELGTGKQKTGDGVTAWNSLPYTEAILDVGIADAIAKKHTQDTDTVVGTWTPGSLLTGEVGNVLDTTKHVNVVIGGVAVKLAVIA